jgi:hypothetical protein
MSRARLSFQPLREEGSGKAMMADDTENAGGNVGLSHGSFNFCRLNLLLVSTPKMDTLPEWTLLVSNIQGLSCQLDDRIVKNLMTIYSWTKFLRPFAIQFECAMRG